MAPVNTVPNQQYVNPNQMRPGNYIAPQSPYNGPQNNFNGYNYERVGPNNQARYQPYSPPQ
jgi:hypothetical protein